jgi:hypothetical protein
MFHVKQWLFGLALLTSSCELHSIALELAENSRQDKYLRGHNAVRRLRGVAPLKWDTRLERHAMSWANSGYGENVAQHWGSRVLNPERMVAMWTEGPEISQILSETSRLIGCASSTCEHARTGAISTIYVCNYFPPESY